MIDDRAQGLSSDALTYDGLIFDPVMREYYGASRAYNVGYWGTGATTQAEASRDLLAYLLGRIGGRVNRVLDVACGLGETTGSIKQRWPDAEVTGINFSARQIDACREFQPDCDFQVMDATTLKFPSETFDLVVCVEAPMHFRTRAAFLAEAWRVLRPGGCLAMSDMLFTSPAWLDAWQVPAENHIPDMAGYREILESAGLSGITVEDIHEQSWMGFCRHLRRWLNRPDHAEPEAGSLQRWKQDLDALEGAVAHYPLTWATRIEGSGLVDTPRVRRDT